LSNSINEANENINNINNAVNHANDNIAKTVSSITDGNKCTVQIFNNLDSKFELLDNRVDNLNHIVQNLSTNLIQLNDLSNSNALKLHQQTTGLTEALSDISNAVANTDSVLLGFSKVLGIIKDFDIRLKKVESTSISFQHIINKDE
jgi:predicted  nucleic acid-binding Zn-ribbon protein